MSMGGQNMVTSREYRKKRVIKLIQRIDEALDSIEIIDPWGDVVNNFEDVDRERITKRLLKLLPTLP